MIIYLFCISLLGNANNLTAALFLSFCIKIIFHTEYNAWQDFMSFTAQTLTKPTFHGQTSHRMYFLQDYLKLETPTCSLTTIEECHYILAPKALCSIEILVYATFTCIGPRHFFRNKYKCKWKSDRKTRWAWKPTQKEKSIHSWGNAARILACMQVWSDIIYPQWINQHYCLPLAFVQRIAVAFWMFTLSVSFVFALCSVI